MRGGHGDNPNVQAFLKGTVSLAGVNGGGLVPSLSNPLPYSSKKETGTSRQGMRRFSHEFVEPDSSVNSRVMHPDSSVNSRVMQRNDVMCYCEAELTKISLFQS